MKVMTYWVYLFVFLGCWPAQAKQVYFADENLKLAIQDELNIWWEPEEEDLIWETRFNLTYENISDLTGIEAAVNLQDLNLRGNYITDVSPLQSLSQLSVLNISENELSDLSGVSALTQLIHLDAHGNGVADLSPLSGMTQLRSLTLRDNNFLNSNLSSLSGLTQLEYLDLQENKINSLSALTPLTGLKELYLSLNLIADLSVLENMAQLEMLDLRWNGISDISHLTRLTRLKKLSLEHNTLRSYAYEDLRTIKSNNPDIDLTYDTQNKPPYSVSATQGSESNVRITWIDVDNGPSYTSYYKVFRALSENSPKQAVSDWQTQTVFVDKTAGSGVVYTYWVQTALSDQGLNSGALSDSVQGWACESQDQYELTVQSCVGGTVWPEPNMYTCQAGRLVDIDTEPWDSNLFIFKGWSGSAVDHGKVLDPNSQTTQVMVDANETLVALYHSALDTLVVDVNAVADANQQGTVLQPLARIQDAVTLASDGTVILVRPGQYQGPVSFQGKAVQVIGADPNLPDLSEYPVIVGDETGPVIRFDSEETSDTMLIGFQISGSQGGIVCKNSSPTVSHCMVTGVRTFDPNLGAVQLIDSQANLSFLTITDNLCSIYSAGLVLDHSESTITNSILWGNIPRTVLIKNQDASTITFSDVQGGWGTDALGNLNVSPQFVSTGVWQVPEEDPNELLFVSGDYHLKSRQGHWDSESQTWVKDNQTSLCIDAGDPITLIGQEPVPHGHLVNLGAYGQTSQASHSD